MYGFGLVFVLAAPAGLHAQEAIRHDLQVLIQPNEGRLSVSDRVTLPRTLQGASVEFLLHGAFNPASLTAGVQIRPLTKGDPAGHSPGHRAPGGARRYILSVPPGLRTVTLQYDGLLAAPLEQLDEDAPTASMGFKTLSPDGIVLGSSDLWYPAFGDELVSFAVEARAPAGWEVISQGERTLHQTEGDVVRARWDSPEPQEEIFLVGGPLTPYVRETKEVTAMAFLREPDRALADRYLDATLRYVAMYTQLLGRYPYKKFALVENFWETGYGMPSFTLLGSRVIRFPFILDSSYPHEILHNWWGNGVFVDIERGNWSEGLTAYLADHLIQEQRGKGAEFRRATLQKYADYTAEGKDFPLTEFRARHSRATEAVGYGKTLMLFHMLRRQLGDDVFVRALRTLYQTSKFRRASFDDVERAFAEASGGPVDGLFTPWVTRAGAPALSIGNVDVFRRDGGRYLVRALVEQTQPGAPYRLRVPVAVTLEGRDMAYQTTFRLETKRLGLELPVEGRPLRVDLDPEFDLFRRVDRMEIPPAFSGLFGAERLLIVLPSGARATMRTAYQSLAETWARSPSGQIELRWDDAIGTLPSDRAVWLLGWENRFRPLLSDALTGQAVAVGEHEARVGTITFPQNIRSVALAGRHPANPEWGFGWLASDNPAALPGLARKLPHYGPFGYIAFEGDEPTNVVKAEWPVARSPLSVLVKQLDGRTVDVPRAALAPRRALAELPPIVRE